MGPSDILSEMGSRQGRVGDRDGAEWLPPLLLFEVCTC